MKKMVVIGFVFVAIAFAAAWYAFEPYRVTNMLGKAWLNSDGPTLAELIDFDKFGKSYKVFRAIQEAKEEGKADGVERIAVGYRLQQEDRLMETMLTKEGFPILIKRMRDFSDDSEKRSSEFEASLSQTAKRYGGPFVKSESRRSIAYHTALGGMTKSDLARMKFQEYYKTPSEFAIVIQDGKQTGSFGLCRAGLRWLVCSFAVEI